MRCKISKVQDAAKMRILRSQCDAKQRSEPNRGEVWRLRHTGVGTATPLTPEQCCKQVESTPLT
eukprot:scaffold2134_cov80-Skeletonema_dohrnii-CCMP3373.AAC.1